MSKSDAATAGDMDREHLDRLYGERDELRHQLAEMTKRAEKAEAERDEARKWRDFYDAKSSRNVSERDHYLQERDQLRAALISLSNYAEHGQAGCRPSLCLCGREAALTQARAALGLR